MPLRQIDQRFNRPSLLGFSERHGELQTNSGILIFSKPDQLAAKNLIRVDPRPSQAQSMQSHPIMFMHESKLHV